MMELGLEYRVEAACKNAEKVNAAYSTVFLGQKSY